MPVLRYDLLCEGGIQGVEFVPTCSVFTGLVTYEFTIKIKAQCHKSLVL